MTEQNERAMGEARVEWAEMLFDEAPELTAAPQPGTELTAQVQASIFLGIYYELRHGHDQMAAHTRALEEYRAALSSVAAVLAPSVIPPEDVSELTPALATGDLPAAREPLD